MDDRNRRLARSRRFETHAAVETKPRAPSHLPATARAQPLSCIPRPSPLSAAMRFWVVLFFISALPSAWATVPAALEAALKTFRAEPPRGWSFTQTTVAEGKSTVERCDATRPEFERWSLVKKDGRDPTPDEITHYQEIRSRRSRGGTAPNLIEQLALDALETVDETAERITYRCRIKRAESGDKTADHLRATIRLHTATQTIEAIELSNTEAFRPALAVHIDEMKTQLTYSLPSADVPSLPQLVATRVRGTAFWFKSLDADMTVTFSDYAPVRRK